MNYGAPAAMPGLSCIRSYEGTQRAPEKPAQRAFPLIAS